MVMCTVCGKESEDTYSSGYTASGLLGKKDVMSRSECI